MSENDLYTETKILYHCLDNMTETITRIRCQLFSTDGVTKDLIDRLKVNTGYVEKGVETINSMKGGDNETDLFTNLSKNFSNGNL